ncbi:PqqD family protein [Mameliella alba]|uniref:Coenzyme PQQ biosynthesis protein PqqD n=1 Tax=Mameliella alba TaxID=561184 RepID=A0A0B3RQK3_9RHOB|nr:PqqD family protein [Mameliella alba]KHQ50147.1 coenzyme PQQ biosynthesis protein PqqD [Mameliella alba]
MTDTTIAATDVFSLRDDQMSADLGSELLMMRVDTGHYYSVEDTAKAIWELIDGQRDVEGIVQALMAEYEVDYDTCITETRTFLANLLTQDLVKAR